MYSTAAFIGRVSLPPDKDVDVVSFKLKRGPFRPAQPIGDEPLSLIEASQRWGIVAL
jgi:hypothetical protein